MPEALRQLWRSSTRANLDRAIGQPVVLPGSGASIHVLGIHHNDGVSACHVTAVLNAVRPDAIAVETPPGLFRKATVTTALRLSSTIKKLSQIQDPEDVLELVSEAEQAAWNREAATLPWVGHPDEVSLLMGKLAMAEILPAVLWGTQHGAFVGGIDRRGSAEQEAKSSQASAVLGAHDLPLFVATMRQSSALTSAGALEWWSQLEERGSSGDGGDTVADLQWFMGFEALIRALPEQDALHFRELQEAAEPAAFASHITKRDTVMAQRLAAMCRPASGRSKGRPPARVVVAVVGNAHVRGIRQQLLRTDI